MMLQAALKAKQKTAGLLIGTAAAALACATAQADVSISGKPTQNMSCSAGVCTATANKAVLNAGDLAGMLASGDVEVRTGGVAKNIEIDAALSWANTQRLTLTSDHGLIVNKPVTVTGTGALTITTNGGHKADLAFFNKGSILFWDLASSLVINGTSYTLVGDIQTLAADIAANSSGFYALAKPYDASADGTYTTSPIPTTFNGTFDGLGNVIEKLTIKFPANQNGVTIGLFKMIGSDGKTRNLGIWKADIQGISGLGVYGPIGTFAAGNLGLLDRCWSTGLVTIPGGGDAALGGLVGINEGVISNSYSAAVVLLDRGGSYSGGLVGYNKGTVRGSYSAGITRGKRSFGIVQGGAIGDNFGSVKDIYSLASVFDRKDGSKGAVGGIVGENEDGALVSSSYASGNIVEKHGDEDWLGGLVGFDGSSQGSLLDTYWNLDKGISDPSQGAGNIKNDPGITGLTTAQLQSGLPQGFDPKVWGQSPKINNGLPYLLSVPPK